MDSPRQLSSPTLTNVIPLAAGIIVALVGIAAKIQPLQSGIMGFTAGVSGAATASLATKKEREILLLAEQELSKTKINNTLSELQEQKKIIDKDITRLEERRSQSEKIAGELEIRQAKRDSIEAEIKNLQAVQQNLESRVAEINKANPTLENLEIRQKEISRLQSIIKQLEGELFAYKSKIAEMEQKKAGLEEKEALYLKREIEIKEISEQIQQGQVKLKDLNRQAVELELLRNTYDALEREKQTYESQKEHLYAEVIRLGAEKDRILAEIKELEGRAQESDRLRAEIADLKAKRRIAEDLLRDIQREIEQHEIIKDNLINDIARKDAEINRKKNNVSELEQRIRELKQEISDLEDSARVALQTLEEPIKDLIPVQRQGINEDDFLNQFSNSLKVKGLDFHERIVKAFHTSLKVQDISALVILAGISGTGKSELPQKYADFIGAPLVMLPVQPRWDSPQDLQGFYNYIEKKYKPTQLMHYLYQYQQDRKMHGRIIMVLLDEMNLARVEYYFSDFLSKLETRRSKPTYLSLDVGSLKLPEKQRDILIPEEFLFIGTMNEDETTQSLSDKVLDRANVLTFGRPNELKLRGRKIKYEKAENYLPWNEFVKWTKEPDPDSPMVIEIKDFVDRANAIMEKLGHPFAHRVYQAIAKYVVNYPGAEQDLQIRHQAIADQFGQKLLPKLRGIRIDEASTELDEMKRLIQELDDPALTEAFDRAKQGRYGQFQWKGMLYS